MPQQIRIPGLTIIFKEPFQFKTLYFFLHEWLMENNYRDKRRNDKMIEINYEEQRYHDHKHVRIWWRTFRPFNSFVRYWITIDYLGLVLKKVDIMKEGKKITADIGEVTLWVNSWVEIDWNDFFKDHPVLRRFEEWYKKRWMKGNMEGHKLEIKRDQDRLQGAIKQYFEMWHYLPSEESYHKKHDDV